MDCIAIVPSGPGQEFRELTLAVNVGQSHVSSLKEISQLQVIEPHQSQDGGIHVVREQWILHRPQPELIGGTEHAPPGKPAPQNHVLNA